MPAVLRDYWSEKGDLTKNGHISGDETIHHLTFLDNDRLYNVNVKAIQGGKLKYKVYGQDNITTQLRNKLCKQSQRLINNHKRLEELRVHFKTQEPVKEQVA